MTKHDKKVLGTIKRAANLFNRTDEKQFMQNWRSLC